MTIFILVLDLLSTASKMLSRGMRFVSLAAPYGFIWHLDFLIFNFASRPYLLNVASSIALTVSPLSRNTVMLVLLISTFLRGLLFEVPVVITVSNVHMDSSLLLDDVSDFCSPLYADSFVALIS